VPTFPSAPRSGVNLIAVTTGGTVGVPLDMTKGSVQQVVCASGGSAITVTPMNIQSGMEMTFIFVQNAGGTMYGQFRTNHAQLD
jgi:hypothetical protein